MANAARVPVTGREQVAKFLTAFRKLFWARSTVKWVEMNGEQSLVFLLDGEIIALASISASTEGIHQILWYRHPGKLAAFVAVLKT